MEAKCASTATAALNLWSGTHSSLISKGASFASVCEAVAASAEESNHVALIGQLMARWLADGIIRAADAMLATSVRDAFRRAELEDDRPPRRNVDRPVGIKW